MKSIFTSPSESTIIPISKMIALFLLSFSLLFLLKHLSTYHITSTNGKERLSFFNPNNGAASPYAPPERRVVVVERTGIVDEMGFMTEDFVVGEFDERLIQSLAEADDRDVGVVESDEIRESGVVKIARNGKFGVCDESLSDYIPCLDYVETVPRFVSLETGRKNERRCPETGRGLDFMITSA